MEKILIVDDEKDNLTILDLYLKQRAFETILCDRGAKAIEIAEKQNPDLVILDIMMPEMDGFAVCRALKSRESTADIPVIFLTARYLDKKDLVQGLSMGAFDYVTKPFDEGELFARISAALRVRRAERSLKRQRDYLTTILNSMGSDLIIITPDRTIEMANEAFLQRRRLTDADVRGKACCSVSFNREKCFPTGENCPSMKAFSGAPGVGTIEHEDPSTGERRTVRISSFPIFGEKGAVEKVVEIQEDVTAELRRDSEVRRATMLLQNIMLFMSEGLLFIADDGRVVVQNEKARKLLEESGGLVDGRIKAIGGLTVDAIVNAQPGEGADKTVAHTVGIGDEFYKLNSTRIDSSETKGVIITIDNITKELKTQEELIQSAKLVSIGELAASIAHEINNPITGIIGYTELLAIYREMLPKKVNEITEKMLKECYRVKNIIENLLKFSRRQQIMDMSYVDLGASLREIVFLMSASFAENNIAFTMNIPPDLPLVYCNSGLIQQAVLNLLQNSFDAILATKKGSAICLDVSIEREKLVIRTKDDGPGIPPDVREKIFEPFFTTKTKGKGTGLGLSLIHRIVQVHSGDMDFATSDEGTVFTVTLPVAKPMQEQGKVRMPSVSFEQQTFQRALIVDDDQTIKEYLSDILYTFKFKVDEARDAKEGRQLIESNEYDLIILDVKLPDGDGIEIYNGLSGRNREKQERVVFITGDVTLDTKERMRRTGRPYLIKPFSFNDLINAVGLK